MKLTDNVHVENLTLQQGRIIYIDGRACLPWYVKDGKAELLRITHPDIAVDDLIKYGEHLRSVRMASERKSQRLAKPHAIG